MQVELMALMDIVTSTQRLEPHPDKLLLELCRQVKVMAHTQNLPFILSQYPLDRMLPRLQDLGVVAGLVDGFPSDCEHPLFVICIRLTLSSDF